MPGRRHDTKTCSDRCRLARSRAAATTGNGSPMDTVELFAPELAAKLRGAGLISTGMLREAKAIYMANRPDSVLPVGRLEAFLDEGKQ